MNLSQLSNFGSSLENTIRQPMYFIGHGSPMNAIQNNSFTQSLEKIGQSFTEKPAVILVISAHWLTRGTLVTNSENNTTIYDFGGFPDELHQVKYPTKGSPETAKEVKLSIKSTIIQDDTRWGLDHGAWTVLKHIFPKADIPVIQLSIDATKPPLYHFELAQELKLLRKKGVLIIGSGNIVHNLRQISFDEYALPFEWAVEFDQNVKSFLQKRDYKQLINYSNLGTSAQLSVPTNDHYLPMLYILGLSEPNDNMEFTYEEIQNSSISMRCFKMQ